MSNLCFSNSLYHFFLSFFNEHDTRIYDISGKQAELIDSKNLKIFDIIIQLFQKNRTDSSGKICITGDQANVNFIENIAEGNGSITISSDEFSATGSDWKFFGNSKNFILNKNVQVSFEKIQASGK